MRKTILNWRRDRCVNQVVRLGKRQAKAQRILAQPGLEDRDRFRLSEIIENLERRRQRCLDFIKETA